MHACICMRVQEMYRVFNMGHRLELFVESQQVADSLVEIATKQFNIDAKVRKGERETESSA